MKTYTSAYALVTALNFWLKTISLLTPKPRILIHLIFRLMFGFLDVAGLGASVVGGSIFYLFKSSQRKSSEWRMPHNPLLHFLFCPSKKHWRGRGLTFILFLDRRGNFPGTRIFSLTYCPFLLELCFTKRLYYPPSSSQMLWSSSLSLFFGSESIHRNKVFFFFKSTRVFLFISCTFYWSSNGRDNLRRQC